MSNSPLSIYGLNGSLYWCLSSCIIVKDDPFFDFDPREFDEPFFVERKGKDFEESPIPSEKSYFLEYLFGDRNFENKTSYNYCLRKGYPRDYTPYLTRMGIDELCYEGGFCFALKKNKVKAVLMKKVKSSKIKEIRQSLVIS